MPEQTVTPQQVLADPQFHAMKLDDRIDVLGSIDPDFRGMDHKEQLKFLVQINNDFNKQAVTTNQNKAVAASSPLQRFGTGVAQGLQDVRHGGMQLLGNIGQSLGLVDQSTMDAMNKDFSAENAVFDPLNRAAANNQNAAEAGQGGPFKYSPVSAQGFGRFMGNTAPLMTIPGPAGTTLMRRALTGGAGGAVMGAAQPVDPANSRQSRLFNTLVGGGLGALFGGAAGMGNKAANVLAGNPSTSPRADMLEALSKEHDIPLTLGDVSGSPTIRKAETMAENIPGIGMTGPRLEQAGKATEAAGRAVDRFSTTEGKPLGRPGDEIQASMNRHLDKVKTAAAKKYEAAGEIANKYGTIPTPSLNAYAKEVFDANADNPALQKLVAPYVEDLGKNWKELTTGLQDESGRVTRPGLDQSLGADVRAATTGKNAAVGDVEAGILKNLREALRKDIHESPKNIEAANAERRANFENDLASKQAKEAANAEEVKSLQGLSLEKDAAAPSSLPPDTVSLPVDKAGRFKVMEEHGLKDVNAMELADGTLLVDKKIKPHAAVIDSMAEKFGMTTDQMAEHFKSKGLLTKDGDYKVTQSFGEAKPLPAIEEPSVKAPESASVDNKAAVDAALPPVDSKQLKRDMRLLNNRLAKAQTYYKENVVPFKEATVARATKSMTPDEIYGQFIKLGKEDRAKSFYSLLDKRGQDAVRSKMVEDAYDKAFDQRTGTISPAKFATSLDKLKEARGVFFKGDDARYLDGLTVIMRASERAGQVAENPPTGNRIMSLLPYLIGAGAVYSPKLAGSAVAGTAALRAASTSPTIRKIIMASASYKPDSPALAAAIKVIENMITKGGTQATLNQVRNP